MAQIQLTNEERIHALRRFDYSEAQAKLVCHAALQGGYVLGRQAAQFLAQEGGGSLTDLIEKIFINCHASAMAFDRNVHLYHLFARSLYSALGQEDNRNRRQRECSTIKQKLMGLDFVLSNRNKPFLATEHEKIQYFCGTLGIPESKIPARVYRSAKTAPASRYFVEKYPIFLPSPNSVAFCFVDEGLVTASHFETFLRHYSQLFSVLPSFQLIYVASRPAPFRWAEAVFYKHMSKRIGPMPTDPLVPRLNHYFELRSQYDAKAFGGMDRAKLVQLRNDQKEFSGAQYEGLYTAWKAGGSIAVRQILSPESQPKTNQDMTFSTHLLEHNYDFLGTITSR